MIHATNFAAGIAGAKLVAMVDPSAEARNAALAELGIDRGYADYKDVLQDKEVDAIVVVTPTVFHKDIVAAAAKAGKHILCEKPMAMTVAECQAMIDACSAAKVKLQIGFMRRFDRNFIQAKAAVDAGRIGDVVLVKSNTRGPSVPQAWMYDIAKSNGPLAEVSSHDIDAIRWFAGSDIQEVYAIAGNYRCPDVKAAFPDFYDNVLMSVKFANGMQGSIDGAVSVGYAYDSRVEILGTKGVLFVGALPDSNLIVCSTGAEIVQPSVKSWRTLFIDAYRGEDAAFIKCIQEELPPPVTGKDGLEAVKAVNAGNKSITSGQPVKL